MSYLLDALRKSEQQKQVGLTPTIHSTQALSPARSRHRWPWLLAVVLVPALLVLAWLAVQNWQNSTDTNAGAGAEQVAQDPRPPSTVAVTSKTQSGATSDVDRMSGLDRQQAATTQAATTQASNTRASNTQAGLQAGALPGSRTPVEIGGNAALNQASESMSAYSGADALVAEPQVSAKPETASTVVSTRLPELDAPAEVAIAADQRDQPIEPVPEQTGPALRSRVEPGPISYWALPQNVRSELMELRISVMVYAELPAERFVLMNGQRWLEGDSPQDGLVLEEIRRQGAVFSYRHYRFLVSR